MAATILSLKSSLTTPARCWLVDLSGKASMSHGFDYKLTLISQDPLSLDDWPSSSLDITIFMNNDYHIINGVVGQIQQISSNQTPYHHYSLQVSSWFQSLHHQQDCRIFQDLSVIDIAREVFQAQAQSHVDYSTLQRTYPKTQYCVQYNESPYLFLCRLFAEHGILFFFTHKQGQHTLHLADNTHAYLSGHGYPLGSRHDPHLWAWQDHWQMRNTHYHLIDDNDPQPQTPLEVMLRSPQNQLPNLDYICYPGRFNNQANGHTQAQLQQQRTTLWQQWFTANSNIANITPGMCLNLTNHRQTFVVSTVQLVAHDYSALPFTITTPHTSGYHNTLLGIPNTVIYRPPLIPKPSIPGTHTAVVTGPTNNALYHDKRGRIKVKFHWDRHNKPDSKSSCWIRTTQDWAGDGFGSEFIPRVGDEVLVKYQNGDPDHPIIIGSAYNAINRPPINLPSQSTLSGYCMPSVPNANIKQGNRFIMDDTPNREQLTLHAPHNFTESTTKDHLVEIGNNHTQTVHGNAFTAIQQGQHHSRAHKKLLLQAGSSSIEITPSQITFKAKKVNFN